MAAGAFGSLALAKWPKWKWLALIMVICMRAGPELHKFSATPPPSSLRQWRAVLLLLSSSSSLTWSLASAPVRTDRSLMDELLAAIYEQSPLGGSEMSP